MHLIFFLDPRVLYTQSRYSERSDIANSELRRQSAVGDSKDERLTSSSTTLTIPWKSYGHSVAYTLGHSPTSSIMEMDFFYSTYMLAPNIFPVVHRSLAKLTQLTPQSSVLTSPPSSISPPPSPHFPTPLA